jgi:hypothetical protein
MMNLLLFGWFMSNAEFCENCVTLPFGFYGYELLHILTARFNVIGDLQGRSLVVPLKVYDYDLYVCLLTYLCNMSDFIFSVFFEC